MGAFKPLQLFNKTTNSWIDDTSTGLTKDSNITDGHGGTIFEDSQGNLWSMGKGTKLQVLIKQKNGSYASEWKDQ